MTIDRGMLGLAVLLVASCTLPSSDRGGEVPNSGHWGWHDPDHDGSTLEDRCPTETGSGEDGCPADDRDDDGVPNDRDPCPDQRDTDALADSYDGCPGTGGPDEDGDGVLDATDACPRLGEDNDGTAPDDGCPRGLAS